MDIKQLRYFIAIAEEGSLSAAAQRVNVAQPSLSQHVLTLERELGVQLLQRSSRGVSLTESGNILQAHALDIVQRLDTAIEVVRQSGSEPMGDVSFGLPSSVSMVLSVPLAETIRIDLPKVRFRAIEAMSGFIQTWLEEMSIDIGILYDVSSIRHLNHTLLMTEELHFFSAADAWPFDTDPGSPVSLAELANVELVLPSPHHGLRTMIDRFARTAGVRLNVATEMDALSQIKAMVARGSGHTILAPAAALDFVERGQLVMGRIVEPQMMRPVFLVRNPAKPMTQASREVERVTLEVIGDLIRRGIWQALENHTSPSI
ncbi:LysR family transcriptional regulator, nitrogen assimilation regulatory protein [Roseovarius azorensis]|uniref:LysR family transcriptional regulator, nitrogen assimilation regulatory protein n=1 Tax=Roseovarius azorensis TaxID=1287727 RepID=A0A1H7XMR6_9RHOB|nr:LysR family transcriptional regulator [Roseovarius azorensis]SEM34914.1 LysR family transcriptional regulator, nitrogen assimilation regulatory protein [Roseovarius azorensis]